LKSKIDDFLMIPIAKPIIGKEEKAAVSEVLDSGIIAQGKKVGEFEEKFADYCGTDYAVAVNSGTAALHVALMSAGVKQGDEVITTPFSFIATGNSILFCGANPVFADIDPKTYNISPDSIEEKINDKTKAIMPVHLFGQPCDMGEINKLAEENGLLVIEDACQAHGAEYKGEKVGGLGDAGCFSFYPTKNMTTSEGGMITTDDEGIAEMARIHRNHGQVKRYYHDNIGYNFRMTDICAAIGLEQLKRLGEFTKKRQENAGYLNEGLDGVVTPYVAPERDHVYHQYTIAVGDRDSFNKKLNDAGVGTGIYYPIPINEQDYYSRLGYASDTPNSSEAAKKVLSIPVHPSLSKKELDLIIKSVNELS
jgi:dTDP-4-amino-4,6-dideoxygalactose transaminase